MARLFACLVALVLLSGLAGCTSTDTGKDDKTVTQTFTQTATVTQTVTQTVAPTPVAPTLADPCPLATPTSTVSGYTVRAGNWSRASADSVVCGEGTLALNSLTLDGVSLSNLEASVAFRMVNRSELEFDAGAGLVVHYVNATEYQIIRYSPREQGWHLFTVITKPDGTVNRTKQDSASVTPPTTNPDFDQWVHLTVRSVNGTITAFDGTTKVIEYVLPAGHSTTGTVGYFLRAQQAAQFEGLTARAV